MRPKMCAFVGAEFFSVFCYARKHNYLCAGRGQTQTLRAAHYTGPTVYIAGWVVVGFQLAAGLTAAAAGIVDNFRHERIRSKWILSCKLACIRD